MVILMDKKLEVKNLQISFRTQGGIVKAVRDISFDLYKGETLAIVGESGSGKSVTSKAIMGILAGNSIVEGGEILYDGQDLLKISEEDYHKIRGDKIAMIFQDPMSSLNPIMRVGQQLTEAMILKAKSGKKNARRAFNSMLTRLGRSINEADAEHGIDSRALVAKQLKTFDSFCVTATHIEREFNEALGNLTQLENEADEAVLMLERDKKLDLAVTLKRIYRLYKGATNPYGLVANEEYTTSLASLSALASQGKNASREESLLVLRKISQLTKDALQKEKPNFFTMGYYLSVHPEADLTKMPIGEMNSMTREFLDKEFMLRFIETAKRGVYYSRKVSIQRKRAALKPVQEALKYFRTTKELDKKKAYAYVKKLTPMVNGAIDRLSVKKESVEYVFHSAFEGGIEAYFTGAVRNPIEEKTYLRNKRKYEAAIAAGKKLDWTLKPQVVVDLELKRANICKTLENLCNCYERNIKDFKTFDSEAHVVEIIDYLKEQASCFVVKMNKKIAKAKAIKLMEEVGIPEPNRRFNQYPFEYSGGMRQRIVIAIALSANPDILICDEPTTALDVTIQAQILELINVIKRERNLSVIFITHNLGVVANMADRIAVMYAGKIVELGTAEEVFYEPAHPYTWALLSSMPDLHTSEKLESIPGTPPNMIYPPKGDAFAARNKYALEIDFELEPPMFDITDTHAAATWLLHPNAPKVEMPALIKTRIERLKKERQ